MKNKVQVKENPDPPILPGSLVLLILLLTLGFSMGVQGQFEYISSSSGPLITRYTGPGGVVIIPDMLGNDFVGGIIGTAFQNKSNVTSIIIPQSVQVIIGGAFKGCTRLTNFSVNASNAKLATLNGVLFDKKMSVLIKYPPGKLETSFDFPITLTYISPDAFADCSKLSSLVLPSSLTSIESDTFSACRGLTNVVIPESITRIGGNAFGLCEGLTSLILPGSLNSIGANAFSGCTGLTNLTIPSSVTSIGDRTFSGCTNLTAVYFQSNAPALGIGDIGFYPTKVIYSPKTTGWSNVYRGLPTRARLDFTPTNLDYGRGGNAIIVYDYTGTNSTLIIPDMVEGLPVAIIEDYAFRNNHTLRSVKIPSGLKSIGSLAFSDSRLTSIFFDGDAPKLGWRAFEGSSAIIVYHPNTSGWADSFGGLRTRARLDFTPSDFDYGRVLGSITIFGYTGAGGRILIPDMLEGLPVTQISNRAFTNNYSLTSLTIPGSVTNIGYEAFSGCPRITTFYFKGNAPTLSWNVLGGTFASAVIYNPETSGWTDTFDGRPTRARLDFTPSDFDYGRTGEGITIFRYLGVGGDVVVPETLEGLPVTRIAPSAFQSKTEVTSVEIPQTVSEIGGAAFSGCDGLTKVSIPGSVVKIGDGAFSYCRGLASISVDMANPAFLDVNGVLISKDQTICIAYPAGRTNDTFGLPESVTSITASAFSGSRELSKLILPGNLSSIGEHAFDGCTNLVNLTIPNSVTNIGRSAFARCTQLRDCVLSSRLKVINNETFEHCRALSSLKIPSAVTNIGNGAFAGCTKLVTIFFEGDAPEVAPAAFADTVGIVVHMPRTSGWTNRFAGRPTRTRLEFISSDLDYGRTDDHITVFGYIGDENDVVIPETLEGLPVTCIAVGAFQNNNKIENIICGKNITKLDDYSIYGLSKLNHVLFKGSPPNLGIEVFGWMKPVSIVYSPETSGWTDAFGGKPTRARLDFGRSDFDYARMGDHIKIYRYIGPGGDIVIPSSLEGLPVTQLAAFAFGPNDTLTSVVIPESVADIGYSAFSGCTKLTTLFFRGNPPKVEFQDLRFNTTMIYLPGTLGWGDTFGGRPARARLDFTPSDFDYGRTNETITIFGYHGAGAEVAIPGKLEGLPVTKIAPNAFADNSKLTKLSVPDSVSLVGEGAFKNCAVLSIVLFLGNAPEAGFSLFGFSSSTVIYLPGALGWSDFFGGRPARARQDFTPSVFDYGWKGGSITIFGYTGTNNDMVIPSMIEGQPVTRIADKAFNEKAFLTSITIPNGVTYIGPEAFRRCTGLTDLAIPEGVTGMGPSVFASCISLTNVILPGTLTNISAQAFFDCPALTSLSIPESVTSIGAFAFGECDKLTSVTILKNVKSIDGRAFSGCDTLRKVVFMGDAPSFGAGPFDYTPATIFYLPGASGWTATVGDRPTRARMDFGPSDFDYGWKDGSITIFGYSGVGGNISIPGTLEGQPVTRISTNAFKTNSSLTSVVIPVGLTNIGSGAFFGCKALTNVTIAGSVSSIGDRAFYSSAKLARVFFTGNAPSLGLQVFDLTSATVYYLSGSTGWGSIFGGRTAALWDSKIKTEGGTFGLQDGRFGFTLAGPFGLTVVVESCEDLSSPIWTPVGTNSFDAGGKAQFSAASPADHPARFYRVRAQ